MAPCVLSGLIVASLCGMGDSGDPLATLKAEASKLFESVRNGVKLAASLVSSMATYVVGTMRIKSLDEVEKDDPDEMEELAAESWQESYSEALPRVHSLRIRKWAGEVQTSGKEKKTLASNVSVGDVNAEDRRSAAKVEASALNYLTYPFGEGVGRCGHGGTRYLGRAHCVTVS